MDYAALRTSAVVANLRKFGTAVTYTSYSDSYDVSTGANTRTGTDTTAYAVVGAFKMSAVDGELVQQRDKRLLIAEIPEPAAGDAVTVAGTTYRVISHRAIEPDGSTAVLYELQVRV